MSTPPSGAGAASTCSTRLYPAARTATVPVASASVKTPGADAFSGLPFRTAAASGIGRPVCRSSTLTVMPSAACPQTVEPHTVTPTASQAHTLLLGLMTVLLPGAGTQSG